MGRITERQDYIRRRRRKNDDKLEQLLMVSYQRSRHLRHNFTPKAQLHSQFPNVIPELDFSQNEKVFHVHFIDSCHKLC